MTKCQKLLGGDMALEAFNNLKEKKRIYILDAISKCLRSTSYDELSVNDIVAEADISRGSFYNYFADKSDAVKSLVSSKVKEHYDMYVNAIIASNYSLFEGTRKVYTEIAVKLSDEINFTIMKNLKFFSELAFETIKSNTFEQKLDQIVTWLIDNTVEGKTVLNTKSKMTNTLDMILTVTLNSIFEQTITKEHPFEDNSDYEYKLSVLEKGIKE